MRGFNGNKAGTVGAHEYFRRIMKKCARWVCLQLANNSISDQSQMLPYIIYQALFSSLPLSPFTFFLFSFSFLFSFFKEQYHHCFSFKVGFFFLILKEREEHLWVPYCWGWSVSPGVMTEAKMDKGSATKANHSFLNEVDTHRQGFADTSTDQLRLGARGGGGSPSRARRPRPLPTRLPASRPAVPTQKRWAHSAPFNNKN